MPTPREQYVNTVQRQGATGARLQAADFGAGGEMVGRALEGFGQDLQRVSDDRQEILKHDATVAAQEADNIRAAKRLERLYGENGFFSQEGKNAVIDREQLDKDLKAIDDEAATLLEGKPYAQRLFRDVTIRRNAEDLPRMTLHTVRERNKYEEAVDEATLDTAIDNAASSKDPVVISQSIQTAKDLAAKQAQRKGMSDPLLVQGAQQAAVGKVIESVAKQMELQSPDEAMAFVAVHAAEMDPDDTAKLLDALAPSAAKERAGSDIADFLVVAGDAAPADATPAAGAAPTVAAGGSAADAAIAATARTTPIPPMAALDAAQFTGPNAQEGAASHTDANGRLIKSPKGAAGVTQVMFKTGVDPGYGVKPLQNDSREEYMRFGRDYRAAMLKEYDGNIVLALTAYNWGPGNVNEHLAKVGDPRKGQISDAAFINSLPNTEAREYAVSILTRAGVSVAGAAGPQRGKPVQVGAEIDLDATVNNIRNSDRSFADKEALIAEATRLHGYGKQVKAEKEETVKEAVWEHINSLPPGQFTDYSKLPLDVRTRLNEFPDLAVQFKTQAKNNKDALENAGDTAAAQKAELDVAELFFADPAKFATLDLRTYPGLSHAKRLEYMAKQEAWKKQSTGASTNGVANYEEARKYINRYAGQYDKDTDLVPAYDRAIRKEEAWLRDNPGKAMPDSVRDGIAREVMMPVTVVKSTTFGSSSSTVPNFQTPEIRAKGGVIATRVDPRQQVRAELQQLLGRIPREEEITRVVDERTKAGIFRK